jgi:pimeloyl-ACP methyl ester carboxylesterase
VLAVGARDPRLAAIVVQCPFTDGLATLPKLGIANILRGGLAGLRDQLRAFTGRAPLYVPVAGEPGSFAVLTTADSKAGVAAMVPSQTLWENHVAARIILRIGCPLLVCVCDDDGLAPADRTVELVSTAPLAEIVRYPFGHFDIYVGHPFGKAVADQIEFLRRHLLTSARSARRVESLRSEQQPGEGARGAVP